ncbi:Pr6Pr family membrane protein [Kitasatospora sp. NBC_00240]|uniref:Pr6Pr family membrane protein n=1 Tax=Kitasatospora sp. NBC_00240 TaxID=2903567 RepID=UPI0022501BEE|nr:Pr6Pr family membrane protein [Kitasatospora sp. NBC_00240]MCX5213770.1 Pr6Pr family membrane protein [Kitasatospora sp. NBC_00240]
MTVWTRPALWWRLAIVISAATGLTLGTGSLVYFTIQSNVFVLAYFAGAVYWMKQRGTADAPAPRLRGAVTLYILITGLVSHILLEHGANPLPGLFDGPDKLQHWSSFFLHYVTPVLVILDWLTLRPRNASHWRDIPLWLAFPLGYAGIVMARSALFSNYPTPYPYFFFDPTEKGYGYVWGQIVLLTVEFVVLAAVVVGLDRLGTLVAGKLRRTVPAEA